MGREREDERGRKYSVRLWRKRSKKRKETWKLSREKLYYYNIERGEKKTLRSVRRGH